MSEPPLPPDGFEVGHWSDPVGMTGCTVVLPPEGARGGIWVMGGGPGTRETDGMNPLSRSDGPTAVLMTGGSAFGIAAADGVSRWLEERERGTWTPAGPVPLVPTAVVFDVASGDPKARPGPDHGYAACDAAAPGVPERGAVGVGTGATVAKVLGRGGASQGGFGYAALRTGAGETVAALAAVNSAGDILAEDGSILVGARDAEGEVVNGAEVLIAQEEVSLPQASDLRAPEGNTTLVCICTDASLDKRECGMVARAATAGIARAVDPTFTPVDGDVVFCLASGAGESRPFAAMQIGAAAATAAAAAIRDAVRQAGSA